MITFLIVLGFVIVIALVAAVTLNVTASMYYASQYAKTTKRRFMEVVRDRRCRDLYLLSRKAAVGVDVRQARFLFDIDLSQALADADGRDDDGMFADMLLVTPCSIFSIARVSGKGSYTGAADAENWVQVVPDKKDGNECLIENPVPRVVKAVGLLCLFLGLDAADGAAVTSIIVFDNKADVSQLQMPDGMLKLHVSELASTIKGSQQGRAVRFGDARRKRFAVSLKLYANTAPASKSATPDMGDGGVAVAGQELRGAFGMPSSGFRGRIGELFGKGRPAASTELMRKADKMVTLKEEFNAVTWDRIIEISNEMRTVKKTGQTEALANELEHIARTNIALNMRFGVEQITEGFKLVPGAGTEESFAAQAVSAPVDYMVVGADETMVAQITVDTLDVFDAEEPKEGVPKKPTGKEAGGEKASTKKAPAKAPAKKPAAKGPTKQTSSKPVTSKKTAKPPVRGAVAKKDAGNTDKGKAKREK